MIFSLPPWFLYEAMLLAADAVPVKVRIRADDLDLDLDAIAAAIGPRTRAVIVNTPHNPTGRIYPRSTLTALADAARGSLGATGADDLAHLRRAVQPAGVQRRRVPQPQRGLPEHPHLVQLRQGPADPGGADRLAGGVAAGHRT